MSAIKKVPVITYEWEDKIYVLEADRGLEFSIDGCEVKLVARSSKHFDIKPKPEPEPAKANVTLEIEIGGKRYAGKLEEKKEEDRVENTVARKPRNWGYWDGFIK